MSKFLIKSPYIFMFYDGLFCLINSFLIILLLYPLIINLPDYNANIDADKENKNYFYNNFYGIIAFLLDKNLIYFFFLHLFYRLFMIF